MIGESCTADTECMSGLCQLASGTCRKPIGQACTAGNECGSDVCVGMACIKPKLTGEACTMNDECAGGTCTSNKCAPWTFTQVKNRIFNFSCVFSSCHQGGAQAKGGLDLKADPYTALLNKTAAGTKAKMDGKIRVIPGDATNSFLQYKLVVAPDMRDGKPYCREYQTAELATSYGGCMPATNPPLDAELIDGVAGWITAGAQNN